MATAGAADSGCPRYQEAFPRPKEEPQTGVLVAVAVLGFVLEDLNELSHLSQLSRLSPHRTSSRYLLHSSRENVVPGCCKRSTPKIHVIFEFCHPHLE
jgi:hypothetical protein